MQKKWRGYIARQKVKKQRAEELEFIGMIPTRKDIEKDNPEQYRATKTTETRREKLIQHENEYQRALVDIKQNLLDTKGPLIREELQDQIRQWFIECRDNSGKFRVRTLRPRFGSYFEKKRCFFLDFFGKISR